MFVLQTLLVLCINTSNIPVANFYLTHPFFDLVSGRSSSWQTAHARVGGVQPLNLEANLEMALFGVSNFERRY